MRSFMESSRCAGCAPVWRQACRPVLPSNLSSKKKGGKISRSLSGCQQTGQSADLEAVEGVRRRSRTADIMVGHIGCRRNGLRPQDACPGLLCRSGRAVQGNDQGSPRGGGGVRGREGVRSFSPSCLGRVIAASTPVAAGAESCRPSRSARRPGSTSVRSPDSSPPGRLGGSNPRLEAEGILVRQWALMVRKATDGTVGHKSMPTKSSAIRRCRQLCRWVFPALAGRWGGLPPGRSALPAGRGSGPGGRGDPST